MGCGYSWLYTGPQINLQDVDNFVRTMTKRQGQKIGGPNEVAFEMDWIAKPQLQVCTQQFGKNTKGGCLAYFAQ